MFHLRLTRAVAICAVAIAALFCASPGLARTATRAVTYRGLTLRVPASWPVFSLDRAPSTCVRFDRHAVYLGTPGRAQSCPPQAIGRTEAIVVSPAGVSDPATLTPAGGVTLRRHGLAVSVTWNRDPALITRALGVRALPAIPAPRPVIEMSTDARRRGRLIAHAATSAYTGLAFDTCSAPSADRLAAWDSSPYRGIGVYIGGANSACAQGNLTPGWVAQAAGEGWHLILTYVGLQAPSNVCGCASIAPSRAAAEGAAAADDAANRAAALGIGSGAAIYFDMENYPTTARNRSAVLTFLAAWTSELHRRGYRSGVYSSASSGVADLVAQYGTGYAEPDELWFADWNGEPTSLAGYIPAGDWSSHQRVHQYRGDHRARYGGVTLDIDSDFIDAATAGASGSFTAAPVSTTATSPVRLAPAAPVRRRHRPVRTPRPPAPTPAPAPVAPASLTDGELVEIVGTASVYRIVGGAPMFVRYWDDIGGQQPVIQISAAQFDALRAVPADGSVVRTQDGVIYVIAGGYPFALSAPPAGSTPALVDIWDIENLDSPLSHLNPTPIDGTVVLGEPSGHAWIFENGQLNPAPSSAGATPVSDSSLSVWPTATPAAPPAGAGDPGASSGSGDSWSSGWPAGNWAWPG